MIRRNGNETAETKLVERYHTLWKNKGKAPLDERQMDTLKNLYIELARSVLLAFMIFKALYGIKRFM